MTKYEYQIIKPKKLVKNPSIESHFAISQSASFSSQLLISMRKKLFKKEKFKLQIRINCNEENKLMKVQNRYQLQQRK